MDVIGHFCFVARGGFATGILLLSSNRCINCLSLLGLRYRAVAYYWEHVAFHWVLLQFLLAWVLPRFGGARGRNAMTCVDARLAFARVWADRCVVIVDVFRQCGYVEVAWCHGFGWGLLI